ncbi:ATP-binding protein [Anaerococcus urinomassiliensis]|uniref:ATP-binding protein n=1 Tax=Anaerococcus urinomassiliensis TaxID=1745712 RepID=UPI00093AE94D|nr:ATP-binding protein [Anaerococcus urinomassiliensis]
MEIIRNLLHSDLFLIKEFRDDTTKFLENLNLDEDMIFKLRLILDELIVNSYKHGNAKDFDKIIEVIVLIDKDYCMIKVKDEGEGIKYGKDRDLLSNHGRGIQIVNTLSDNLIVKDNMVAAFVHF